MSKLSSESREEAINKHLKAAEIAKTIKTQLLPNIVSPNANLLVIAETIEKKIKELGGLPAFPVNICIGHVAAHYTPLKNEKTTIPDDTIIKIDFGIHIDGYIVDTAISYYFGEENEINDMIITAREAVNIAVKKMKPGVKLSDIGSTIEDFVNDRGYKVIENLNGHLLEEYNLHGEKEVPVSSRVAATGIVEKDEVYAIEVFVTNGEGWARSTDDIRIYSVISKLPKRLPIHVKAAREILRVLIRERKELPFTPRWLLDRFNEAEIRVAIATLEKVGILIPYPVLIEKEGSIVAQAEETVIVTSDGAKIIT